MGLFTQEIIPEYGVSERISLQRVMRYFDDIGFSYNQLDEHTLITGFNGITVYFELTGYEHSFLMAAALCDFNLPLSATADLHHFCNTHNSKSLFPRAYANLDEEDQSISLRADFVINCRAGLSKQQLDEMLEGFFITTESLFSAYREEFDAPAPAESAE